MRLSRVFEASGANRFSSRLGQACRVDGQENVGRAVGAFVLDAFQQLVFLALDAVDLDAGLLGEVVVERFVGLVMAGGVEVEDFSSAGRCSLPGGLRRSGRVSVSSDSSG
jgi:hypothetical protein